jgi:hypothetical protein
VLPNSASSSSSRKALEGHLVVAFPIKDVGIVIDGGRAVFLAALHHVGQCVLRLWILLLLEMRVAFLEVEFLQIGVVQLVGVHLGELVRHGLEPFFRWK